MVVGVGESHPMRNSDRRRRLSASHLGRVHEDQRNKKIISPAPRTRPKWRFLSTCSPEDPFCEPGLDLDLQELDKDLQGLILTPRGPIWTAKA